MPPIPPPASGVETPPPGEPVTRAAALLARLVRAAGQGGVDKRCARHHGAEVLGLLTDSAREISTLRTEIGALRVAARSGERREGALRAQLASTTTERDRAAARMRELEDSVAGATEERAVLAGRLGTLEAALERHGRQLARVRAELDAARSELGDSVRESEAAREAGGELRVVELDVRRMGGENAALRRALAAAVHVARERERALAEAGIETAVIGAGTGALEGSRAQS